MLETVLLTGGAGYIGAHTAVELLNAGHDVVVLDNLSNSSAESLARVARICGRDATLVTGDVRDEAAMQALFRRYPITAVIHFAGLKAVAESVANPLAYFDNNVTGSICVLKAMARAGIFRLVFSSSATVYGPNARMPVSETSPLGTPTNPYGRSKLVVEQILHDLACSDDRWKIGVLRYFNPVGAHGSGLIGEDPTDTPNNLVPYIAQVAVGRLERVSVFGDDYPTPDGSGIRDYIHVCDLAEGHLGALRFIGNTSGLHVWNLGTGIGRSVFEVIRAFERASGRRIPYVVAPRRAGDMPSCWADVAKAAVELNWSARRGLEEMLADSWRWQSRNPAGYSVGADG